MILQYRGTSFISRLIRWFTWGKYSHASWSFCTVRDGKLHGDLSEYGAWTNGGVQHVDHIGQNHTLHTRIDLYDLRTPLAREEAERGILFMQAQIGKKYDYRGLFGFLFREKMDSADRWFCSELVFTFLRRCGRMILQGVKPYQVNPQMIPMSPEVVSVGYIYAGEGGRVYFENCVAERPKS